MIKKSLAAIAAAVCIAGAGVGVAEAGSGPQGDIDYTHYVICPSYGPCVDYGSFARIDINHNIAPFGVDIGGGRKRCYNANFDANYNFTGVTARGTLPIGGGWVC